jgi:hypothetical protein
VPLGEGAKRVELTFASDSYARGKLITIISLVLSLLAVIAGLAWRDTRPRSEGDP